MNNSKSNSAISGANALKRFALDLKHGPYKCNFYHNGRILLIGGKLGHVAALDWITKDLLCEFNCQESVHAVQWLHVPTMYAVAQKDWVHIYDNKGIELNVVKNMYRAIHLDFLYYHLLLASASDNGYLNWLDITMGKTVATFNTRSTITALCHSPTNALLFNAHPNGTVSMWSPNHHRPAVSMLCHATAVRGVTVASDGNYFATTGLDREVKIWDLRSTYKCLKHCRVSSVPDSATFSQRDMLAVAVGRKLQVFKDCIKGSDTSPTAYLQHDVGHVISNLNFCKYEDVIGVGHGGGYTSLLVPGSGEAYFDSFEANPFMSVKQRQEMEVKLLLDKIPSEMICLDPKKMAHLRNKD